jgi:hypothetical protein
LEIVEHLAGRDHFGHAPAIAERLARHRRIVSQLLAYRVANELIIGQALYYRLGI